MPYDCWEVADAVMGVSPRILLRGKPGTGKTYHAVHSALRPDQDVYTITMTEETPAAELRGHYVPKGSDFVWQDGPAITAWREGARLVINEIDRSSEDVLSLMYALLDDPDFAELTLPTGEKVRPAEGFQVIATMNGLPEDLPDALQDRLPVDLEITDVNPAAIERLPEDLREPAKNTALAKTSERGVSIRMWLEFASLREKLPAKLDDNELGIEIAAKAIFGDKAQDALTALTVSARASEDHDMAGGIYTPDDIIFLNVAREWGRHILNAKDHQETTYRTEEALSILSNGEVARRQTAFDDVYIDQVTGHLVLMRASDSLGVTLNELANEKV